MISSDKIIIKQKTIEKNKKKDNNIIIKNTLYLKKRTRYILGYKKYNNKNNNISISRKFQNK